MNLAENLLNIADQYNNQKEIELKEKENENNKILKEDTKIYWEKYFIPLLEERAKKGYYKTTLMFAQKGSSYAYTNEYYPVKHIPGMIDLDTNDLYYEGIKNKTTHLWYSFSKFHEYPISLEELEQLIKINGFYLDIIESKRADTPTGKYTRGYVYTYIISCKPFKEKEENIAKKEEEKNNIISIPYKGPYKIEQFLISHHILYEKEFCFPDCKYQKALPFDFVIFDKKHQIKYAIEYDGEQHFKFIQHWHKTEEGFKQQQLRDKIKTDFCEINNIKLIRISYIEYDNIENILINNLIK